MLKIKVFSVRQAMNSLAYGLIILLLIVFAFFVILSALYILERELKDNFIDHTDTIMEQAFSNKKLASRILETELSVISIVGGSNMEKEEYANTWDVDKSNQLYHIPQESSGISETAVNDEIEIEETKLSDYQIPEKYQVEQQKNGNIIVGKAKIINYSNLNIDLEELAKPASLSLNEDTSFLIFHTHTTESYTVPGVSDITNYRTTNEKYNMVTVGNALHDGLSSKGFYYCVHDTKLHDYPNYNGAYKASLETVQDYLKQRHYDFVLDIHRDALSSNYGFRPTVEINGDRAAKIMFVIGTNGSGLNHENWMKNLKLALLIQNRAEEMYPGFFRDLTLSSSRYNQHVSEGAFIIEVGATGNTLEEARNAMKYLSNVFASFK
ncbi:MAG: stage II sporulation protein P [Clostridia bacterium]|nr:stage II sporulation protein P [Clostridia bacterium]